MSMPARASSSSLCTMAENWLLTCKIGDALRSMMNKEARCEEDVQWW
jgi:hypothetical protein